MESNFVSLVGSSGTLHSEKSKKIARDHSSHASSQSAFFESSSNLSQTLLASIGDFQTIERALIGAIDSENRLASSRKSTSLSSITLRTSDTDIGLVGSKRRVDPLRLELSLWRLFRLILSTHIDARDRFVSSSNVNTCLPADGSGISVLALETSTFDPESHLLDLVISWLEADAEADVSISVPDRENVPIELVSSLGGDESLLPRRMMWSSSSGPKNPDSSFISMNKSDASSVFDTHQTTLSDKDATADLELFQNVWFLLRAGRIEEAERLCVQCGQPWLASILSNSGTFRDEPAIFEGDLNFYVRRGNRFDGLFLSVVKKAIEEMSLNSTERNSPRFIALKGLLSVVAGDTSASLYSPLLRTYSDALWVASTSARAARLRAIRAPLEQRNVAIGHLLPQLYNSSDYDDSSAPSDVSSLIMKYSSVSCNSSTHLNPSSNINVDGTASDSVWKIESDAWVAANVASPPFQLPKPTVLSVFNRIRAIPLWTQASNCPYARIVVALLRVAMAFTHSTPGEKERSNNAEESNDTVVVQEDAIFMLFEALSEVLTLLPPCFAAAVNANSSAILQENDNVVMESKFDSKEISRFGPLSMDAPVHAFSGARALPEAVSLLRFAAMLVVFLRAAPRFSSLPIMLPVDVAMDESDSSRRKQLSILGDNILFAYVYFLTTHSSSTSLSTVSASNTMGLTVSGMNEKFFGGIFRLVACMHSNPRAQRALLTVLWACPRAGPAALAARQDWDAALTSSLGGEPQARVRSLCSHALLDFIGLSISLSWSTLVDLAGHSPLASSSSELSLSLPAPNPSSEGKNTSDFSRLSILLGIPPPIVPLQLLQLGIDHADFMRIASLLWVCPTAWAGRSAVDTEMLSVDDPAYLMRFLAGANALSRLFIEESGLLRAGAAVSNPASSCMRALRLIWDNVTPLLESASGAHIVSTSLGFGTSMQGTGACLISEAVLDAARAQLESAAVEWKCLHEDENISVSDLEIERLHTTEIAAVVSEAISWQGYASLVRSHEKLAAALSNKLPEPFVPPKENSTPVSSGIFGFAQPFGLRWGDVEGSLARSEAERLKKLIGDSAGSRAKTVRAALLSLAADIRACLLLPLIETPTARELWSYFDTSREAESTADPGFLPLSGGAAFASSAANEYPEEVLPRFHISTALNYPADPNSKNDPQSQFESTLRSVLRERLALLHTEAQVLCYRYCKRAAQVLRSVDANNEAEDCLNIAANNEVAAKQFIDQRVQAVVGLDRIVEFSNIARLVAPEFSL